MKLSVRTPKLILGDAHRLEGSGLTVTPAEVGGMQQYYKYKVCAEGFSMVEAGNYISCFNILSKYDYFLLKNVLRLQNKNYNN